MKMFGIRRNKKKKKINGAPPGYFTNELHEFTFNTPEMRMGIEEPSKNKKKRHKGERSTQEKRYQRERERERERYTSRGREKAIPVGIL